MQAHACTNVNIKGAHIGRSYLHKHQPLHTHRYAYPGTDRQRYSHTQLHPQRYSQLWDKFYTYKVSFNTEVYLQLPTRHNFQQRHVNNTRLTFKIHLVHKPT